MSNTLNDTITVYRKVYCQLSTGQQKAEWQAVGEVWGLVRFQSGKEFVQTAINAENTLVVRVRRGEIVPEITADDRIVWEGMSLNIISVQPLNIKRRAYLELVCRAGSIDSHDR